MLGEFDPTHRPRPRAGASESVESPRRREVHLVINPKTDGQFAADVEDAVMRAPERTPPAVATLLRPAYPRVLIRQRELSDEPVTVWYVYREGHWVPA